jgi:U3 small nucleolar RNA-associated protein 4
MPVQRGSKRARTDDDEPSAGLIALHRSRFIDWQPAEVVALAASGDGSVVAAAREDGDIELYETTTSHCFQVSVRQAGCLAAWLSACCLSLQA